ncbi:hypothetical protein IBTHAUMO2_400004 [Nitrosopumilaceae archaeon]|nr:hypothetical protein IBTHAUMO2_400004 [Nitrosopumilaceae archaeon]
MPRIIDHDDLVLRLVQKASPGGVEGKKALQKMIYFFTLEQGGLYYRWANYGPFSPELHHIVVYLLRAGKIRAEPVPTGKPGATISRMTYPVPEGGDHNDAAPVRIPDDLERELDSVLEFAGRVDRKRQPRELELLASVHFLAASRRKRDGGYVAERIHGHLAALKPKAGFDLDDVKRAIRILEDESYL